jgi:hypothetical protein
MDVSQKETEWWWIDYLENELDSSLEADLEMLLQHSQEDRDSFENFRLLKQWVRESDPILNWPIEERLELVRAKIMSAIEDMPQEKASAKIQDLAATKSLRT